jgi:hypothetical protein
MWWSRRGMLLFETGCFSQRRCDSGEKNFEMSISLLLSLFFFFFYWVNIQQRYSGDFPLLRN